MTVYHELFEINTAARPTFHDVTAAVILFLASDEASYVAGSAFVVDGGQIAG